MTDHPRGVNHIGYRGQHLRVERARGKPSLCEHCLTTDPAAHYQWAFNNVGDRDNVEDYIRLCGHCHYGWLDIDIHRAASANSATSSKVHGEDRWNAKLTDAIVLECKARNAAGEAKKALAREFGVSPAAMRNAINGKAWKHITDGGINHE